jgi:MFS family permease
MFDILKQTKTALLSLFILILGNGLLTTLLPLRLHWENVSTLIIGGLTTAYYAGLVVGSFKIEPFIIRVGHIRAFATFASLLAVLSMLHGFWDNAWFWIVLRFLEGICTAALYVVIESWLLAKGTLKTRGQILSFYMVALYGAQAASQFLLNIGDKASIIPFCIVCMLATLSVVPLAMTKAVTPEISKPSTLSLKNLYQISPTGVMGSFVSGLILSAIYGLMPLYLGRSNIAVTQIAVMMAVVILGGMLLQYPIGRFSDKFDRRIVLIFVCALATASSVLLILSVTIDSYVLQLVSLLLLGGATFTLYPLSISHACDHLKPEDIVGGTQGLLLIYSAGATIGPIFAAFFMRPWLGANGLIVYLIVLSILLGWFLLWRRTTSPQKFDEPQQEYITIPQTTPIVAELDPRSDETLSPSDKS